MNTSLHFYWKLFCRFRQLEFMRMTHNRKEFLFWTGISIMWAIMNMVSISLYININGNLGGWKPAEVFVLLSFYAIIDTFIWDWIDPNMVEFQRLVNTGELSTLLMKPINIHLLLMIQKNSFNNSLRFLFGVINLLYWFHVSGQPFNLGNTASAILFLFCSIFFIYGLWFILTTLSLWTDRLENVNEIVPNLKQFWQVPSGVYRGVISLFLTFILPLSLITTVPAETVLGSAHFQIQLILLLSTIFLLLIGKYLFEYSLRQFQGTGG